MYPDRTEEIKKKLALNVKRRTADRDARARSAKGQAKGSTIIMCLVSLLTRKPKMLYRTANAFLVLLNSLLIQ